MPCSGEMLRLCARTKENDFLPGSREDSSTRAPRLVIKMPRDTRTQCTRWSKTRRIFFETPHLQNTNLPRIRGRCRTPALSRCHRTLVARVRGKSRPTTCLKALASGTDNSTCTWTLQFPSTLVCLHVGPQDYDDDCIIYRPV